MYYGHDEDERIRDEHDGIRNFHELSGSGRAGYMAVGEKLRITDTSNSSVIAIIISTASLLENAFLYGRSVTKAS